MALPVWPGSVPLRFSVSSYDEGSPLPKPYVTTFEDGNTRSRPRSLTSWVEVTYELILTNTEYAALRDFFHTTLGNQSARFTMPVWRPGQTGTTNKEVWAVDGLKGPTYAGKGRVKVALKLRVKNW